MGTFLMKRRAWSANVRQHGRYLTVLVTLSSLTVGIFLVAHSQTAVFEKDLLINLGATLGGVVLTVLVLQPVIEHAQAPEVIVHSVFPSEKFQSAIRGARSRVRLMGAWPYTMDTPYREGFLDSLRTCLSRGVRVQVLLMHPLSDSARQRTVDIRATDAAELSASERIAEVLIAFHSFRSELSMDLARNLEVRLYYALPPGRLYLVDDHAFCSFFGDADNRDGSNVRHYETSVISGLGYYINEAFGQLWSSHELLALNDYWELGIHLFESSNQDVAEHRVPYVLFDDCLFLISQTLVYEVGHDSLPIRIGQKVAGFGWDGFSALRLTTFDRRHDSRGTAVVAAADMKYGDEQNVARSFLEISAVDTAR